ncbi:S8 family serine peptidase [Shewanella oncorhynchi]|uniref:S8 family serine peptidase n=1 Tax=Shewanella TaxID=22 RepID=UPI001567A050|nr:MULTISPECIES: S8 family serine peptidase [unclassified Shewanella]MCU8040974.1 S8 family serine peptidase [Shewanella sp. SM69]NRD33206.1 S8 family serine peptidase [Shewanella sp. DC2-4]
MKTKLSIAISAALLSSAAIANSEFTFKPYSPEISAHDKYTKPQTSATNLDAPQRFIVEMESPALAKYRGGIGNFAATALNSKKEKLDIQSTNVKSYSSHLAKEQNAFASNLAKIAPNAKVERHFQTLFNGITVVGQGLSVEKIAKMPGVKAVYPEAIYETNMDASHQVINTPAMWEAVSGMANAGKGMKVAIIDGGIRPENPMFTDAGFTAPSGSRPSDDYCSTVDASFCNNKLIVARWSQPTSPVCPNEYMSPLSYGGHGTHVAGTAVGNKISTTYKDIPVQLSGVAPAAYLMVYKALYSKPDCTGGTGSNIMLMEALEHAVNDGADVINNSWGGSAGSDPASSPYKTMFEAAEAAGVVVVSAAGNDGNGPQTIGCPACIESGITVANTTTGRFFANSFNTGGDDLLAIPSSDAVLSEDITAPVIAAVNLDAENANGCDAFAADSFKDGIALISRGTCNFSLKATNAKAAGAKALVVYNNAAGAPTTMSMPGEPFPAVMITKDAGLAVIEAMGDAATTGTIVAKTKRIMVSELADNLNSTSSRGPDGNQNILKPDIAAPGTNILSAFSPDDGGEDFNMISGTSMASPHVAGAAAMMRQLHPDWSANDIKTALTSTAKFDDILDDDATTPATPFGMGAGRMDLDAAAKAILTFDKPSIASDSCVGPCTFTRTVYNKSNAKTSWNLSTSSDSTGITVSPSSLELAAGASATFTVTVDSTFAEYGEWIFGNVMISSTEGLQDAHLPLAVLAKESSDASLISTMSKKTELNATDAIPISVVINNNSFDSTVTITAQAPEGTKLTSKDDVKVSLAGATQNGLQINEDIGNITWVGSLNLPKMTTTKGSAGFPSIVSLGVKPITCPEGCDEQAFTFTVPSFKYNGVSYSSITMSDNGLAIVGGGSASGTFANKKLPDGSNPNNILAPFWSDFDLSDKSAGDTGGGDLAVGVFTDDDGVKWLALEWNKGQLYGDTSNTPYTFSIWIKTGDTEEVVFNYINIPNMPSNVTIGAENIGGTIGTTYHFNGEGDSVVTGNTLTLKNTTAGNVTIDYLAKATEFSFGTGDMAEATEETSIEIDLLANDINPDQKVARASITGNGITASAQRVLDIAPVGTLSKATVVDAPANGAVTISEAGIATYQPKKDFFGTDSFTYSVEDADGNVSKATKVTVTVANVNDAPTVAPTGETLPTGQKITVMSNAKDVDGDALTYIWTQTSGPTVTFDPAAKNISFTPKEQGTYTFTVIANDGTLNSNTGEVTAVAAPNKNTDNGGGSLGWLTALLLPLAAMRRRMK